MANTYSQILIQAVFAVQGRESMIKPEWKENLFKYIGGIFRKQNQKLLAVGGVDDRGAARAVGLQGAQVGRGGGHADHPADGAQRADRQECEDDGSDQE